MERDATMDAAGNATLTGDGFLYFIPADVVEKIRDRKPTDVDEPTLYGRPIRYDHAEEK